MNIVELLEKHNIPHRSNGTHHHARAGWVQVDCPYCASVGGFHMGLCIARPRASCWRCGSRRIGDVLWQISGGKFGLKGADLKYAHTRQDVVHGNYKPPAGAGPLHTLHKGYLLRRGYDCDMVEHLWRVTGTQWQAGPMLWRLVIPIFLDGRAVSWTSRSIAKDPGLRYISADPTEEAVPHKSLLYGEEHCGQSVIVCEGPLDVWAIGPGAVCTFGTAFTPAQLNRLARFSRRVLVYDSDANRAGENAVAKLAAVLSMLPGTNEIIKLDTGSDPGAAHPVELTELRQHVFGNGYGCGKLEHLCT